LKELGIGKPSGAFLSHDLQHHPGLWRGRDLGRLASLMTRPSAEPPIEDIAAAFEGLRREVSLTRSAVEGLTAARERVPDYSVTLGKMAETLAQSAAGIRLAAAQTSFRGERSIRGVTILARIARAHLDIAMEEGRIAAGDASADEDTCPYFSHDQPMARHAWLRGFREPKTSCRARMIPFAF
jgi:ribosome modulation factor